MSTSAEMITQAVLTKNEKLEPGQYKLGTEIYCQFNSVMNLFKGQYLPFGEEKPQEVIIQIFSNIHNDHKAFDAYYSFVNALQANPNSRPYQVLPIATQRQENVMMYRAEDHRELDLIDILTTVKLNKWKETPPRHILLRILLDIARGICLERKTKLIPANDIVNVGADPINGMNIGHLQTSRGFANVKAILLQNTGALEENLRKFSKEIPIKENKCWSEYVMLDLLDPNTILAKTSEVLTGVQANPYESAHTRPPENIETENNHVESDAYRLGALAWQLWILFDASENTHKDNMRIFNGQKSEQPPFNKVYVDRIKETSDNFLKFLKSCTYPNPVFRPFMENIKDTLFAEYQRHREEYIKKNKLEDILKKINDIKVEKETKMRSEEQVKGQPTPQPEVRFQIAKNPSPLASPAPSQTGEGEPSTQEDSDAQPGMPKPPENIGEISKTSPINKKP